ncbi:MAG: hypothetical protein K9M96_09480 [Deltaproteobacteria bacterium]|nr:hypothetical protein [Deltaproteobacteria bacterium]MCF8120368.1 hypothetical protein [Deltaproteobacteria bacterium]
MSIAYPVIKIAVTIVVAMENPEIAPGSVWKTGNLLFRAPACGRDLLPRIPCRAHAVDARGRGYLLYAPDHPKATGLVSQALDSCYCFEIFSLAP